MSANETLGERRERLLSTLYEGLKPELSEEHQNEIAHLVAVLPDLDRPGFDDLIGPAELTAKALFLDPPNIQLASEIREDIERRIRRFRNPLFAMMRGGSPPSVVILGLGVLLYFVIPLLFVLGRRLLDVPQIFGVQTSLVVLVSIFGALGSIVSIMVRIQDFANLKTVDTVVLFFTGFFKPIIGTSFALFVFAVLSSGLLPLTVDAAKSHFFFAAISFVSGFSERFAQDIASKTEKAVNT